MQAVCGRESSPFSGAAIISYDIAVIINLVILGMKLAT